jgi:hypothetical protein
VLLGIDKVPAALPMFHGTVGASGDKTWSGCEANHEEVMPQGTMNHDDAGNCFGWIYPSEPYNCWDKGWCDQDAKAKISCDTASPECKRLAASTVQSGTCNTDSGGTENCVFLDCQVGSGLHSMTVKATTQANGSCSIHTNVELLVIGQPVEWELEYKTPDTAIGQASVKFSGTIPSHSVYQVFQATLCCRKATDSGKVPDGSGGTDDGSGSGTDDGSGSGTDDGSGSGTDDGSGSGTDDGSGSGTDAGPGSDPSTPGTDPGTDPGNTGVFGEDILVDPCAEYWSWAESSAARAFIKGLEQRGVGKYVIDAAMVDVEDARSRSAKR